MAVRAVIWDFGGVLSSSPFEAFLRYEQAQGLPEGFIRKLNATNPDDNAWAQLERRQVDLGEFVTLFEAEAEAAGHPVDGRSVLGLLGGELRPAMLEAVRRCREKLTTGLLTNNYVPFDAHASPQGAAAGPGRADDGETGRADVLGLFDVVVESSKVGVRKPDPAIYELVLDKLGVTAAEAVFLDDLGVNLKPARAMGMTTIKVSDPDDALAELETAVGFPVT